MAFSPSLSVLTSVYRGENYLPDFFRNLRNQTLFTELELILVLNEPTASEKRLANDFQMRLPDQVVILYAHNRETLGASWNRAWTISRAPYLAMWNVDDRRRVDSLQRQLAEIEQNPDWSMCYGDYVAVSEYGEELGIHRPTPTFSAAYFRRTFPQGGAFWLFRRSIFEVVGYFDEQFLVGADMELSLRMAVAGLEMGRCEGLLGYFTDAAMGLSTRDGARISEIERTVIQLRYGVYDKVNRDLLGEVNKYRLDAIKQSGSWILINTYLPNLTSYLQWRRSLWIVGFLRHWFRVVMARLGLLRYLHNVQDRYLKREI